jgi:hypothetical protein
VTARRAVLCVAALASAWASARAAYADAPPRPPVSLAVDPCIATDAAEVRRIAAVELDARLAAETEPDATKVIASCEGALVRVEVTDPLSGKAVSRLINLASAVSAARARLLAIAIAELVSASWTELVTNPTPAVPPAGAPAGEEAKAGARRSLQARAATTAAAPSAPAPAAHATFGPSDEERKVVTTLTTGEPTPARVAQATIVAAPPVVPEASPPARRAAPWRIEALLEGRALPSSGVYGLGAGASISRRSRRALGFRVDVLADHAQTGTALGAVTVDAVSTGPSLFLEARRGLFALDAGVGVRVGIASFAGRPKDSVTTSGTSFVSAWGGPFANAGVQLELGRGVALVAGGEVGDAPFPARGTVTVPGGEAVSIAGVWFGGHGGAAVLF